ncbi:hypothetical protein CgunFtcFv8_010575 [Champsocephalus gunnari]|uniref:Ig-like domain-containing protein n=1 Tax=Champsocephalus gunnari TaxID=52237 RepID=A0AAN8DU76_CHAGU|nr:hypothetical protein CgunFtcFv8_010575 [Champsocephalus gunnari]
MTISIHFALLIFLVTQDFTSCINLTSILEYVDVALGDPLTLNCTYNCSIGFVRGCWSKANKSKSGAFVDCLGNSSKSSLCTTSLHLTILSTKDHNKKYICYTQHADDPQVPQNIAGIVVLQIKAKTSVQNGIVTPKTATRNASNPAEQNDSSGGLLGEFAGIKVLAIVTVAVATVLAALAIFLCLNRNRQCWTDKGEPVGSRSGSPLPLHAVPSPVKGTVSTKSERVTLRIPTPDNESDTEVPYADITIAVRGVSTPELTQVGYLTPGDQQEWWGDEPRSHLQASRSADRLHVPQPREVSRKMSTNSEYAVITYA